MRFAIETSRMNDLGKMLSCLVESATVTMDPEGWSIKAVDNAHVAMLVLRIKRTAFSRYEAGDEMLELDVKRLKIILQHLKGSDSLEIEGTSSKLRFTGGPLAWTMRLNEPDIIPIKEPVRDMPASLVVNVDDIRTGTKAASDVAKSVMLRTSGKLLILFAQGDTDEVELKLPIEAVGEAECMYPLDYFHNCITALPGGKLRIALGNDLPAALSMTAWDGSLDVKYLIAPQIVSEEG